MTARPIYGLQVKRCAWNLTASLKATNPARQMTSVLFRALEARHKKELIALQKKLNKSTRSATVVALIEAYQRDSSLSDLRAKQLDQLTGAMQEILRAMDSAQRAGDDMLNARKDAGALLKSFALRPRQTRIDL